MLICTLQIDQDCPALGSNCECFPWCELLKEDGSNEGDFVSWKAD